MSCGIFGRSFLIRGNVVSKFLNTCVCRYMVSVFRLLCCTNKLRYMLEWCTGSPRKLRVGSSWFKL